MVADVEELETRDASEIYSERLNAKEAIFPKENGKIIFPAADGRISLSGRDQELRTSTLIRERPIQGEGHPDFLGESEGSLSPPHDSFPDAGPIPLKYIDVSRTTHSNLDAKQECRIDDLLEHRWGQEICLILGKVSLSLLYWKRNLQTDMCGPGGD